MKVDFHRMLFVGFSVSFVDVFLKKRRENGKWCWIGGKDVRFEKREARGKKHEARSESLREKLRDGFPHSREWQMVVGMIMLVLYNSMYFLDWFFGCIEIHPYRDSIPTGLCFWVWVFIYLVYLFKVLGMDWKSVGLGYGY